MPGLSAREPARVQPRSPSSSSSSESRITAARCRVEGMEASISRVRDATRKRGSDESCVGVARKQGLSQKRGHLLVKYQGPGALVLSFVRPSDFGGHATKHTPYASARLPNALSGREVAKRDVPTRTEVGVTTAGLCAICWEVRQYGTNPVRTYNSTSMHRPATTDPTRHRLLRTYVDVDVYEKTQGALCASCCTDGGSRLRPGAKQAPSSTM